MTLGKIRPTTREGILFILSAPSGTGKTTLVNGLISLFPEMTLSVSCTTRARRQGETEGRDYRFVTEGKFRRMRASGEFAEWAVVHGFLYGTPRKPLDQSLTRGRDMLLDIDVQGARQIKRKYPGAVSIFLLPPSWRELKRRLAFRGTDKKETIRQRLENAQREIKAIMEYDYYVVNRDVREALERLKAIVVAERFRISRIRGW